MINRQTASNFRIKQHFHCQEQAIVRWTSLLWDFRHASFSDLFWSTWNVTLSFNFDMRKKTKDWSTLSEYLRKIVHSSIKIVAKTRICLLFFRQIDLNIQNHSFLICRQCNFVAVSFTRNKQRSSPHFVNIVVSAKWNVTFLPFFWIPIPNLNWLHDFTK